MHSLSAVESVSIQFTPDLTSRVLRKDVAVVVKVENAQQLSDNPLLTTYTVAEPGIKDRFHRR